MLFSRKILSRIIIVVAVAMLLKIKLTPPRCLNCITPKDLFPTYDFIVVGGGTAGSIIAAELAANPSFNVLLIEAGGPTNTRSASLQSIPGLAALNVASGIIDWGIMIEPQMAELVGSIPHALKDRKIDTPRGKILGGSNELNYMLHVRASDGDYDGWAELTDDESWNSVNMKNYYSWYENRPNSPNSGKVSVGLPKIIHPVADAWVKAAGNTPVGNMTHCNDGRRSGGCHMEHAIRDGVRHTTARAFLLPELERRGKISPKENNLHVLLDAQVVKLNLSPSKNGHGVAVTGVTLMRSTGAGGIITVHAAKEVILSAGAYHSPQILMLSGIGPQEHLQSVGISPVVDLPGVGAHLQDHQMFPLKIRFGSEEGSWWPRTLTRTTALVNPKTYVDYISRGAGPLSTSCVDVSWFSYSNDSYRESDRPDLQLHGMLAAGDTSLFNDAFKYEMDVFGPNTIGSPTDWSVFAEGIAVAVTLLHPEAEGTVRLASSNAFDAPIVNLDGYSKQADIDRMVAMIHHAQELLRQEPIAAYSPTLLPHHQLANEFGFDTKKYWEEYIKRFGKFIFHPTGTCRMGKVSDPMTVVDSMLRVVGVNNLRVADASIMPEISSGNTNMPTATIAIKLVDMLRKDYFNK